MISRANSYLQKKAKEDNEKLQASKIDKKILDLGILPTKSLLKLAEHGIKKLDDLADLSAEELIDVLPDLDEQSANDIIVKSRAHWFK